MVLCKEFAGKAEAAVLFFLRRIRHPAGTKKAFRLVLPQVVLPVARADTAVLHADLPVLLGIFNSNRVVFHNEVFCAARDKRFLKSRGIGRKRETGFTTSRDLRKDRARATER